MKCKVTIQKISDGVEVEIPMFFTGYSHVENGQLILIEFPDLNPVSKGNIVTETSEPVKKWWEFWR